MTQLAPHRLTLSTEAAAQMLDCSRKRVTELCEQGAIKAFQESPRGRWYIHAEALEEYAARKTGRPYAAGLSSERAAKLRTLMQLVAQVNALAAELLEG